MRGGSQESDSEFTDDEIEPVSGGETLGTSSVPMKILSLFGRVTVATVKGLGRGFMAAFQGPEETDESKSLIGRFARTVSRIFSAALSTAPTLGSSGADNIDSSSDDEIEKPRGSGFGHYLARTYKVDATRDDNDHAQPVLGGGIMEAMSLARSQARLLLVLIPASKPGKIPEDSSAIDSFLSLEVAKAAERKARKSGPEGGSFLLWGAKQGSSEATIAIKRLKAQAVGSKGKKRPVLLVAYLAQVTDRNGILRTVPRLLAQHHCSPPPDAETMAAWLNALRKRHAKQYITMETQMKEIELYKERKDGYKDSVKSDNERKAREAKEAREKQEREAAEKKRQEELKERRVELFASLPEEPDTGADGVKTVALRFSDGRTGKRRFEPDTHLQTLFDWVDGEFEIERETVVLTTMNGKLSFAWDDRSGTLSDRGLSKMVGLRVSVAEPEEKRDDSESDDGNTVKED